MKFYLSLILLSLTTLKAAEQQSPKPTILTPKKAAELLLQTLADGDRHRDAGNYAQAASCYDTLITQKSYPKTLRSHPLSILATQRLEGMKAAGQFDLDHQEHVTLQLKAKFHEAEMLVKDQKTAEAQAIYEDLKNNAPFPHHWANGLAHVKLKELGVIPVIKPATNQ